MHLTPGRFATEQVREFHEFLPDELTDGRPERRVLPVRPLDRGQAIEAFRAHLPGPGRRDARYPFDDRAWHGEWVWHEGGLSAAEGVFWFVAMTDPDRWVDHDAVVRRLEVLDVDAPPSFDAAQASLSAWFIACAEHRDRVPWYMFAYLARLMSAWMPGVEVLACFEGVVWADGALPVGALRYFVDALLVRDDADAEALGKRARALMARLDLEDDEDVRVALTLLRRAPLPEQIERLARVLIGRDEAPPHLVRDAIDLIDDPELFAECFARSSYPVEPSRVGWILARGGFGVVEALVCRVARGDGDLQRAVFKDLMRIHSPAAVPGFLMLWEDSAVQRPAHGWLSAEGANAIEGCLRLLDRARHPRAEQLVREYVQRGHRELVESLVATRSGAALTRLNSLTLWDA